MPSDSVFGPISKNFPVGPKILRKNLKFFGFFSFLPKLFKYLYYIIMNYSESIRELKFSKHAFSENLPRIFFEMVRKDLESSEVLRNHQIIIINSYLSIRSPKHGLRKSRVLPETYIIFRIDLIYSDYTRILPISQIQYI